MPVFPLQLLAIPDAGDVGELSLTATHLGDADGRSRWRVVLAAGTERFRGGVALQSAFGHDAVPWFLFPGFFYGQGRSETVLRYPALGQTDVTADDHMRWPAWAFALDRGAYPIVLARLGGRWLGIDASPHYALQDASGRHLPGGPAAWGDSEPQIGIGLGWEHVRRGHGFVAINLPAWEQPYRHARNPQDHGVHRRLDLAAGTRLVLDIGVWDFAGDRHGYQRVLETVYDELRPRQAPATVDEAVVLSDCAAHGLKCWHWVPPAADGRPGYLVYTAAMDRSVEFNANVNRQTSLGWHFEALGFVGGFAVAFGLLTHGQRRHDAEAVSIAEQLVDRWCREGQAPGGLFRTSYHPGRARTPNGEFANAADAPSYGSCWQGDPNILHARTTADAAHYLARFLARFPRHRHRERVPEQAAGTVCALDLASEPDPRWISWRASLRRALDAALRLQLPDGRHPQRYDLAGDRAQDTDGAGGLLWIAAMHHGEPLFADDPDFQERLRASMLAAGAAYAADVEAERICGAPEDVSLAPTSEDGYNAVMAYGALHRRFADTDAGARWLRLLIQATDWMLTWRKAYNVRFPRRNALGAGDFRSVGGDFASANNNHLHVYGMCCLGELHRLSRITGKAYYARRADDHLAFVNQLLCVEDGQWNGQRGMLTEQFYTSDWSIWDRWDPTAAHVQKGTYMGFSHVWCVNMVLLGLEELERERPTA